MYVRLALLLAIEFQLIARSGQTREPVPDAVALGQASQAVENIYKTDIAAANKPEQKAALADRLLETATATTNDAAGRFALLARSRDLAIQAGNVSTALAAMEQIVKLYAVNDIEVKTKVLNELARLPAATKSLQEILALADDALDEAVAADRFDLASKTIGIALSISAKANDPVESRRWEGRRAEIGKIEAAYGECRDALTTLKQSPADPAALLAVGRYDCYMKGDWDRGLPMIAAGADAALKSLALADLAHPASAEAQMPVADRWWSVADKEPDPARLHIRQHAASIYANAAPQLAGLARAKVDKRIEEASAQPMVGRGIDLLRRVDLKRDKSVGKWSFRSDGLHCEFQDSGTLVLPYIPPEEYDIQYSFTAGPGTFGIGIALPVGKGLCNWTMGHFGGNYTGFDLVDGKGIQDSSNPGSKNLVLKSNHRYSVNLQIRKNGVRATIDGTPFVDLRTDGSNLSRYGGPGIAGNGLALIAHQRPVVFHNFEIVEISGKGKPRK